MKRALTWFSENTVAANLLMILIMAGGLLTVRNVKMEIFPELSSGFISVTVEYLGATPEEVEEAICVRIEEEVQDVDGVKKITSTAYAGVGVVNLEMLADADSRKVLDDVKARIDAIDTLPEEAEKPVIQEIIGRHQVINVALFGNAEESTLKFLGQQVRDELAAIPEITHVTLANARPYEISIEVSEDALRRHDLSFDDIANAIRRSSLDIPAGSLKTPSGQILLRTKTQAYRGPEFEKLALITQPDGTRITLGDVAHVVDGFEDTDQRAGFDGKPTVILQVFRVGKQNALTVSSVVHDYVEEASQRLPEGISLETWQDNADYLRSRRDLLLRNALYGLILVFTILTLFLRFKLAVWVCVGLVVSFLGAIWLMPSLDVSINMISLFAFILALGVVVDDAIVVGENIYSHQKKARNKVEATVNGVVEVSVPVIFAVLTSVAAMLPLLVISGTTGKIMRVVPLIFIPALLFSLIESLLILPAHLAHGINERPPSAPVKLWLRFQGFFSGLLESFVEKVYRPVLDRALEWRYLTLATGLSLLILTAGMVGAGWIRFVFFPPVDADYVTAMLDMPQGTAVGDTAAAVRQLETKAHELEQEIEAKYGKSDVFKHVLTSVAEQPQRTIQALNAGRMGLVYTGSHLGEVTIELEPAESRPVTTAEIESRWRELTGPIAGVQDLTFTSSIFSPGAAIDLQLSHPDLEALEKASEEFKAQLARFAGVYNVADSHQKGKLEIQIRTKETAEPLGLSQIDVARQVRQGFYGEESQRVQRERDDIKVMVRYPSEERDSIGDLENMRIRTPDGLEVPLTHVASTQMGRGYATIRRSDRRRTVNVTADVDKSKGNANEIIRAITAEHLPALKRRFPALTYSFEGQAREQSETLDQLFAGFVLALLMIYALLAVPFKSYLQPVIVLSAIPFGLVGAVLGHLIFGMELTILSMFGIVALAGVVVNDSLVLVDYINRRRREGMPLDEAVRVSGAARFRPIILTSLTTFAGLTPLLLEKSVQAKFLIPMGISLGFGVMFSTLITLILLPSAYLFLEDMTKFLRELREHWAGLLGLRKKTPGEVATVRGD